MAANSELAGQITELLFNKVATPIQIADASKNLHDAYRPESTLTPSQQQTISSLNQTAGSAGMISAATGYAEIYAAYASSGGKVASVLGKTSIGFGAVAGGANILLYQQELQKVSGDYSQVQTGATL